MPDGVYLIVMLCVRRETKILQKMDVVTALVALICSLKQSFLFLFCSLKQRWGCDSRTVEALDNFLEIMILDHLPLTLK
eukprot:491959-Amphidinium_carterae.2